MSEKQKLLVKIVAAALLVFPYNITTEQIGEKRFLKLRSLTWGLDIPLKAKVKGE
ncbi:MAG: hypothetical protein J5850_06785 [Clostridia bacterium]|nr:hypothetical protein [Clostridia bacterium]